MIGTNLGGIAEFMEAQGLASCLFAMNEPDAIVQAIRRQLDWSRPPPRVQVPGMDELTSDMLGVYERALSRKD